MWVVHRSTSFSGDNPAVGSTLPINCSKYRKITEENGWLNLASGDRAYRLVELKTLLRQPLDGISDQLYVLNMAYRSVDW